MSPSARLGLGLLGVFRGLHRFGNRFGSLESGNCYESRDARSHLHHPAEDAQTSAHDAENGIVELGLSRLGLCHSSTHDPILSRSGRGRCAFASGKN
jgi:hypothetical protein